MDDIIFGRNPVLEAIKAGTEIDKLLVQSGLNEGSIGKIKRMARDNGIIVTETSRQNLDRICECKNHQGIAAYIARHKYCQVSDILKVAESKGQPPFVIIADEITDPHNLGSLIRSADCAGAHGIIIPKRNSCSVNSTVAKTSAGSVEYANIAKVSNIAQTIEFLKENNVWVYGADMNGSDYRKTDFSGGVALVIGNEGKGVSRLVKEKCDVLVKIPMFGNIDSLNASVAAGILMFEVSHQRNK